MQAHSTPSYNKHEHKITLDCSQAKIIGDRFQFNNITRVSDLHQVKINKMTIPFSFYNFSSALGNSSFSILRNGTPITVSIADGFYTLSQLLSALQTDFATAGAPISLTQNSVNKKMTLTITASTGRPTSDSWLALGFKQSDYIIEAGNIFGNYLPDVLPVKTILVNSNLASFQSVNSVQKQILGTIPVAATTFGELIFYNNMEDGYIVTSSPDSFPSTLWITFEDCKGRTIDWNGVFPIIELALEE